MSRRCVREPPRRGRTRDARAQSRWTKGADRNAAGRPGKLYVRAFARRSPCCRWRIRGFPGRGSAHTGPSDAGDEWPLSCCGLSAGASERAGRRRSGGAHLVVDPLAVVLAAVVVCVGSIAVALAVDPRALVRKRGNKPSGQRSHSARARPVITEEARAKPRQARRARSRWAPRRTSNTSPLAYCSRPGPCIWPFSMAPEYMAKPVRMALTESSPSGSRKAPRWQLET